MKNLTRTAVIVVILLVVALVALQAILKNHLGTVLETQVVPALEEQLKVGVAIDGASINLLAGSMNLSGVKLGNPADYQEPSLFTMDSLLLDVGIKNLLMGNGADVSEVRVNSAELTVVRHVNGAVNVVELFRGVKTRNPGGNRPPRSSTPRPDPAPGTDRPEAAARMPPVLIRSGVINTRIRYIDHTFADGPLEIELENRLTLEDIGTRPTETGDWGTLRLRGSLAGDRELSVADLRGRLAPIPDDPMKVSFDLKGTISRVDITPFTNEMRKADFQCAAASLDVNLVCRDGEFDPNVSSIRIVAHEFEPLDSLARRLPDAMSRIERLELPLSVAGPLSKPRLGDFSAALFHAFASLMQQNGGSIAKQTIDQAVDGGETDKLMDKAGLDAPQKEQVKKVLKSLLGTSRAD
ncbi:MAG: hypothetical protein O2923_14205 [Verrucomicrobia bacterium]|nr:hypothetical protein [Verrucomicrobiota bacterium]MDA1087922.1 hypothetical protein [Verrucomicrobiota bacterium]